MGLRGPGARAKSIISIPDRELPWMADDLTRVERLVAFMEFLPITKGILAGQTMKLLPEQIEFIDAVYGNCDEQGRRKVRLAIRSEPRGGGKTGFLAGLCLAHLLGPESEPRGECYSAAIDKQQAGLLYREMEAIIQEVPEFEIRTNCQRFHKRIEVLDGAGKGSIYESLSADVRRGHGLAPSFWVYDEFAQAKTDELLHNLQTAQGKRKESLGVVISTQAANDQHPLSILIDDAMKGTDPGVYCQLICAPDEADPFDEETWKACNPAWGIFLDETEFRAQAQRAQRIPSFLPRFLNLRLNMRVEAEERFIRAKEWDACGGEIDLAALKGRKCYGGLDLGSTRDLSCLTLIFPMDDGTFHVLPFFFVPGDNLLEREDVDKVPYWTWNREGFIEATPGAAMDYSFIVHRIGELVAMYDVEVIAFDRWRIEDLKRGLSDEGIEANLQEFGQGYKDMAPAIDFMETLIVQERLRHAGHPVLRWNARNAVVTRDAAGNRKLDKERSREKIDGLVSMAMALAMARRVEEESLPACLLAA
ncbi:terminase TerL endonuclease subunit [uncultured Nitratireductor sp.]|uniref:terminase large subunit n=1 Tax=uncultured Nitratireductor sp. TaxID=520953 RepID=UPI00260CDFD3|nr:terminase TerL endonuclease subunit [uncultured Nitratireductor sp.]